MILFTITYAMKSIEIFWVVGETVSSIVAISFLLIQLRIGLGLSSWYDGTGTRSSGPMFARSGGELGIHSGAVRVHTLHDNDSDRIELGAVKSTYAVSSE
jgi:hypothetical protein